MFTFQGNIKKFDHAKAIYCGEYYVFGFMKARSGLISSHEYKLLYSHFTACFSPISHLLSATIAIVLVFLSLVHAECVRILCRCQQSPQRKAVFCGLCVHFPGIVPRPFSLHHFWLYQKSILVLYFINSDIFIHLAFFSRYYFTFIASSRLGGLLRMSRNWYVRLKIAMDGEKAFNLF